MFNLWICWWFKFQVNGLLSLGNHDFFHFQTYGSYNITTCIQVSYRHRGSLSNDHPDPQRTGWKPSGWSLRTAAQRKRDKAKRGLVDRSVPKKWAISHIFTGGKIWEGFKFGIPLENLKKPLLDFCTYTILYLNLLNLSILFRQTGRTRPISYCGVGEGDIIGHMENIAGRFYNT